MQTSEETFGWLDEGAGEPVVLLHSSAASSRQWRRLIDGWGGGYRTLALDLYGYGETPLPSSCERFSLDDEAALAERLIGRFDGPFHLVGHSYGGAVALRLARRVPDRILSVTVHEPVLFHLLRSQAERELREILEISARVTASVEAGRLDEAAEVFVDYWNGKGAWRGLSASRRAALATAAVKAPLDFAALFRESDPPGAYRASMASHLVTVGDRTREPAKRVAEILGASWGEGALAVLPGAGHMAPIVQPELFRAAVDRQIAASRKPPAT